MQAHTAKQQNKLLIICGPTATGKTNLAQYLAKKFDGELISADSRQVYRGLDIGTGKELPKKFIVQSSELRVHFASKTYLLTAYILKGIPVWLYDVVEPNEEFSVAHYTALARPLISDIWQRGKLPIVVGGTGLYISSILRGIGTEGIAPKPELRGVLDKLSLGILQKLLAVLHSHAWDRLNKSDRANPRRLMRKIEIAMSGKDRETGGKNPVVADTCIVGLSTPFQYLDEKINRRVDERVKQGIVREIETLLSRGVRFSDPAMTSLGYREWQPFFTGARDSEIVKREIIATWKNHERQYARRQMTWFRRVYYIRWFDIRDAHVSTKIERMASAWYTGVTYGVEN